MSDKRTTSSFRVERLGAFPGVVKPLSVYIFWSCKPVSHVN